MHSEKQAKDIAARIIRAEEQRQTIARFLRKAHQTSPLFFPVKPQPPDTHTIVGVDGGLVKRSFHGFDLLLVRAAGVCFTYHKGTVQQVVYHPSRFPLYQIAMADDVTELDWLMISSLTRIQTELRCALACLKQFQPDILLLDGSLVPHYADKPSKTSPAYSHYQKVMKLYQQLYEYRDATTLAGVVEDSRGSRACDFLCSYLTQMPYDIQERIQKNRDTNVLHWAMKQGERTLPIPYTQAPEMHPVLKDFPGIGEQLYSFFLKPVRYDRPLRIDVFGKQTSETLAPLLLALSGKHAGYGIPAPLIEADTVAKLSETELDAFFSHVMSLVGTVSHHMQLRRHQRPF